MKTAPAHLLLECIVESSPEPTSQLERELERLAAHEAEMEAEVKRLATMEGKDAVERARKAEARAGALEKTVRQLRHELHRQHSGAAEFTAELQARHKFCRCSGRKQLPLY